MKLNAKAILGIAISLLLLWWALRDVSLAEVANELRQADPVWFFLAVVTTTFQFVIRAARWRVLLLPVAPRVDFRPRFAATNIGFAFNNLFPARIGEFARAYSLSRLTGIPIGATFASLVVERIFDAIVLLGLLFVAMASPAFPVADELAGIDVQAAARAIAVVAVVAGGVLLLFVLAPDRSVRIGEALARRFLPRSLRAPVMSVLHSFLHGLGALRDTRLFLLSAAWAVGQWLFLALSFVFAFRAFGITQVGFIGAVFLQSLIGLAVAVPSSPGFFGPYEAAVKLGLSLWGVPAEQAVSMAIGFHIGGFIPVTVMGLYYLWRLGLSWKEVEQSEEVVEEVIEHEDSDATGVPLREGAPGA